MAERARLDPTIDEIVAALRETTRSAGRASSFGARQSDHARSAGLTMPGSNRGAGRGITADAKNWIGLTDVSDLRDAEIERLLTENARQSEQVVFLLKVIEREQARNAELTAERAAREADRSAILGDMRAALEAELRPVLLLVLRLLKTLRVDQASDGGAEAELAQSEPAPTNWATDNAHDSATAPIRSADAAAFIAPRLRQQAGRVLDSLRR